MSRGIEVEEVTLDIQKAGRVLKRVNVCNVETARCEISPNFFPSFITQLHYLFSQQHELNIHLNLCSVKMYHFGQGK